VASEGAKALAAVLREGRTEVARVDDKITEYGVLRTKDGKIAVRRCKSERSSFVKVERGRPIRVQSAGSSTEDGGWKDSRAKVQIGAVLLWKSGKGD
jgi:hypothetical protein